MKKIILCLLLAFLATPTLAQRVQDTAEQKALAPTEKGGEGIAAVVNESVISTADIRARVALAMLTSGLPDNDEVRKHLLPQVLKTLIDEQLQLQEGKRLDISISQSEVDQAIGNLSKQNNVPGGDILKFLASHNVPPSTLIAQGRATLTWNKVVTRSLRSKVDVSDDEIDAAIARLKANAGKEEFLVSEIFLAVDNPKDEEQVKALVGKLVEQIKTTGNFGAIARQFSQGSSAANGGDIGWIQAGELSPDINKVLVTMDAQQVSVPIRSTSGYHILGVREKRIAGSGNVKNLTMNLTQAFLPFSSSLDKDAMIAETQKLRAAVGSCSAVTPSLRAQFPAWSWQDLGDVKLDDAPPWLAEKIRDLQVGKSSDPVATDKGAIVVFVCSRKGDESFDRDQIMGVIGTERLELQARRLMRDLRRNAYIDIRLPTAP